MVRGNERRQVRYRTRAQIHLLRLHIEKQATCIDSVDMRFSADECDVMPDPDEQNSKVTSNGSGANNCDFHLVFLISIGC